ncbi:MAG: hypothetical protein J6W24_05835 [Prevotella sp.]|nr:hypothetical protein [Prevotella sp.]
MWPWLVFSVFFYTLLIYAWVVGLRAVQRYQPERAVTYYFIMASIRFVMALTVVALYMLFAQYTHEEAVTFCLAFTLMYVAMVIISIILKH